MDIKVLYERLTILDGKCSALLQLSSVILALNIIPVAIGKLSGIALALSKIVAIIFLFTSLLSLFVIWIEWEPSEAILRYRTYAYRFAVVLTAIGLICIAFLIISAGAP